MKSLATIAFALAVVAACATDPAGPDVHPGLAALAVPGGITVLNQDAVDRFYILFDAETASRVDLSFFPEDEPHWIRVVAGGSRLVTWSEIHGFEPGTRQVVIHSWTGVLAHPVGDGVQWLPEGFVTRTLHL